MTIRLVGAGLLLLLLAVVALAWLRDGAASAVAAPIDLAHQTAPQPAVEGASVGGERVEVPAVMAPVRDEASEAPEASTRAFDEIFNDLVELWAAGAAGNGGDLASATAELVTELLVAFPDAGERTLMRVAAMPVPWSAAPSETREVTGQVAQVVLDFVLQRLAGDSQLAVRLPLLVDNLLDSMPLSAEMAEFTVAVLADRPYLEARHEALLIELARRATGPLAFLAAPVQRLLLTLWHNLRPADGERRLADLLTWFADPAGGPLRTAAMQRLLTSERYRDLVVGKLIDDGDATRTLDAALFAVQTLPTRAALATLSALQSSGRSANLVGAYAWLAVGEVGRLTQDYEECLADNITPRHREALIAAVGNAAGDRAAGLACARTAFDMDPDPQVRGVAFLALCNGAAVQVVSDCLGVAMSDPQCAANYALSYLVSGVRALAQRDDRDLNLLDLATQFLLSQSTLESWDREIVEAVRREYVPR